MVFPALRKLNHFHNVWPPHMMSQKHWVWARSYILVRFPDWSRPASLFPESLSMLANSKESLLSRLPVCWRILSKQCQSPQRTSSLCSKKKPPANSSSSTPRTKRSVLNNSKSAKTRSHSWSNSMTGTFLSFIRTLANLKTSKGSVSTRKVKTSVKPPSTRLSN